jgi:hypothetical protein
VAFRQFRLFTLEKLINPSVHFITCHMQSRPHIFFMRRDALPPDRLTFFFPVKKIRNSLYNQ